MITEVGNYSESEFRMDDSELIRFCSLFSENELDTLINLLYWVHDTNVENEIMIAEKILEKEQLEMDDKLNYINISEKVDLLTDKELMFLHTISYDANFYLNYLNSEKQIDEVFGPIYEEIACKLEEDVTDEIEQRIELKKSIVLPVSKTLINKP